MKIYYPGKATLFLLILVFIFSCQTEQEKFEEGLNMVFTGDSSTLKKINFSFFDGTTSFTKGSTTFDSSGNLILSLPNNITRLGVLQMPGINKSIFVSSNDTIALKYINKEKAKDLVFKGQNSFHYNSLDTLLKLRFDSIEYSGDIKKYKRLVQRNYDDQKKLLEKYYKGKRCSSDFREVINIELKSEYFSSLIKPLYSKKITLEEIPDTYFEDVTTDIFNNDLLLKSRKGTLVMKHYLDHYFTKSYPKFSEEKFKDQEMFITENFNGNTEEFALTDLLYTYTVNLLPSNIDILKSRVSEYKTEFTNEKYRDKLSEIENKLSLSNNKLPDSILNINLTSLDDNNLKIQDLLTRNKVVVIDVWATWCYWCFFDMEEAKDFKEQLIDQGKVEWIYVSIDKQKDLLKWKNISETKKDLGLNKNQYLLDENDYSKFSEFFNTDGGIPKYLVFNKEGLLVLPDGPRPTDSSFFGRALNQLD